MTIHTASPPIPLPDVIHADELPGPTALAWLQRQGKAVLVDAATAVSTLVPDSVPRRAEVAARLLPRRCTACGLLALWVWEGGTFPARLEALCAQQSKTPVPHSVRLLQRRLAPGESMDIAGLEVTTPLRTAVDLACLPDDVFDERVGAGHFVTFLVHHGLSMHDCLVRVEQNCRAVGYGTGRRRLEALEARPEVRLLLTPLRSAPARRREPAGKRPAGCRPGPARRRSPPSVPSPVRRTG